MAACRRSSRPSGYTPGMPPVRFSPDHTALLVVDMQEKLLPHIHEHEKVLGQCCRLAEGAGTVGLPRLVTEQYRKGLGVTVESLASRLEEPAVLCEKMRFSADVEPVRQVLTRQQVRAVVLCGIESHVCVLQTALDLMERGLVVAVAADATGSRRPADRDWALQRMAQAGVVPVTVESLLLELVREAGTPLFKAILPLIREPGG